MLQFETQKIFTKKIENDYGWNSTDLVQIAHSICCFGLKLIDYIIKKPGGT